MQIILTYITFLFPISPTHTHTHTHSISRPDGIIDYNATRYGHIAGQDREINHEREIGPQVEHIYAITNGGPSTLPPSTLYLVWPTRTLKNEPLLYLMETPLINAPHVNCFDVGDVNYLGLTVCMYVCMCVCVCVCVCLFVCLFVLFVKWYNFFGQW